MTPSKKYAIRCLNAMDQYIDEVMNGEVVTGRYERLAVERHLNDLMTGGERGLVFDEVAAAHFFQFAFYIRHSKGVWSGDRLMLEGWQCFKFAMMFGWKKPNEHGDLVRRFNEGYEKVARKNGKTTSAGIPALYALQKDGEGGPEVYAAATKKDQAKQLFNECKSMARKAPEMRKTLKLQRNTIENPANDGVFLPLSSDANTLDGLNPHVVVIDELHAHKNAELYEVLDSAFGARSQHLLYSITTEGVIRGSINDRLHDYATGVLDGNIKDDSFFAIIFMLDEGDDYYDESNWRKANPNIGVSCRWDYLRDKATKAKAEPSFLSNFLTKHMNVRVNAAKAWADMVAWKAREQVYDLTAMAECTEVYGGLDLANVSDITSFGLVGVLPDGRWRTWSISWLPEDIVMDRMTKHQVPYESWAREGWLHLTPGNVTDYDFIEKTVLDVAALLPLVAVAFDRWNSSQLVTNLMNEGIEMLSMGQGYASLSPPMKELERRYTSTSNLLEVPNNPLLAWTVGNVIATEDPSGNIKPDKSKSQYKIDPFAALVNAAGAAMNAEPEESIDDFLNNPIVIE